MQKIGFVREHAIEVLTRLIDPDEQDEAQDYNTMTNDEIESELCLSGCIYDEHMGGVFDFIPEGMQNAEKNAEITGWPVTPI